MKNMMREQERILLQQSSILLLYRCAEDFLQNSIMITYFQLYNHRMASPAPYH